MAGSRQEYSSHLPSRYRALRASMSFSSWGYWRWATSAFVIVEAHIYQADLAPATRTEANSIAWPDLGGSPIGRVKISPNWAGRVVVQGDSDQF